MSRNLDPRGRRPSFFARRRNEALQKGKLRAYAPSAPAASSTARPVASTHSQSSHSANSARSGGSGSRHGSGPATAGPHRSQRQQLSPHTQPPPEQKQQRGRRPSFYARRQSRGDADRMVYSRPQPSQQSTSRSAHRPIQSSTQQANATPRDIPVVGYSQPPVPSLPDPSQMSREDLQLVALRQAAAIRALQQQQQQQQQQRQSPRSPYPIRHQISPGRPGIPSTEGVTADTIEELAELDRAIQQAQANQIGKAKSKEEQAKEDRDEAVAGCCYDCCCFSLV